MSVISDLGDLSPFRLLFFSGLLLLETRSDEGVVQAVIPLVAGMLKYRADRFRQGDLCGPRPRPRRLIFDCEFVTDGVGVHATEAFGHAHVFAGSSEGVLAVEIRR